MFLIFLCRNLAQHHPFSAQNYDQLHGIKIPFPKSPKLIPSSRILKESIASYLGTQEFHSNAKSMIGVLGFDSRRDLENFLFTTASRTALGPTQPPIQRVPGALSLGVKRPGCEADHSPPSSAEVKNA
jgi:hypothetical protein